MPAMPLAHVTWAIADEETREACEAFFVDVLGAKALGSVGNAEQLGVAANQRPVVLGGVTIIPVLAATDAIRRTAQPMRWLGLALRTPDLAVGAASFAKRDVKVHNDPGMEGRYFLISPGQAMGLRIMVTAENGSENSSGESAEHPLGIEGLQAIGISTESVDDAGELFAETFGWMEMEHRELDDVDADCAPFLMGGTVLEALESRTDRSALARHARDIGGIYCLTFKVKSAPAAAAYLRSRGLELVGNVAERFAIRPDQAFGRMIYFTDKTPAGYPAPASH